MSPTAPDRPGPGPADEPDALSLAWARALAAARARGMRPGMPGGALGGRARTAARYRAGQEVTLSGAGKDGRDPVGIADVTGSLVTQAGWTDAVAVGGVMGRWPEVVGEHVATHCVPVGFAQGTLTVRAATTAWATQLRLLVPDVRRRLDAVVGEGVVAHIEVLGPDAPSWKRGRLSVRGRGARDTYG
jgi:predicted nucleic acid-binding Zn ribbon protein